MIYKVKSIWGPTIEGEGFLAGTPVFFIRFAGCNMWDGQPDTKEKSWCPYCDTNFINGKDMTYQEIVTELLEKSKGTKIKWVVISGGEPTLQITDELICGIQSFGFKVAIESNGTVDNPALQHCDHVTFSPKTEKINSDKYDSLKLLFPHPNKELHPDNFKYLITTGTKLYLQPVWDKNYKDNLKNAIEYIYKNPEWRLSLQTHKIIGVE